ERPPRRALRRFVLPRAIRWAILGAVPVVAFTTAAWPAVPALALLGAGVGLRAYRGAGVRLAGDIVVMREARLARRTL
ncbi:hypothetical protein K1T58_23125, partial [Salmonella enterica]|uniref:hypothetical protein n=1 Tax=Salmonella enterica TaxID=28901 RepID=UPI001C68BBA4